MDDNENGSQAEETAQIPATEVADSGSEVTDGAAEVEETKAEEGEHAKRAPWFQKRIDELTREKWEARREADAAKALAEAMRSQHGEAAATETTPQNIEELVTRRAAELRDAESFNEACNITAEKGKEAFQDFDSAVQGYQLLGGPKREFLEAINALPNGPQLFYHLGKHLDEGAHVLSLPPVKMALELTKLSAKLAKAPPVSKAPAPIKPLGGSVVHDGDPMKLPIADWIKWRDEQVSKGN
jgi:hypothetical protein